VQNPAIFGDILNYVSALCAADLGHRAIGSRTMGMKSGVFAGQLRRELALRNRMYARGRSHVESYGGEPVVVYEPDGARHGNFYDPAYAAICARPEWMRRFGKIHAQAARCLPKPQIDSARKWRELDSSMSSDALLMNVFCTAGVVDSARVRSALGVDTADLPDFGWKARVPLNTGLFDRTEVDMRWGELLIEAKLTESDFQTRKASIVEGYRDFDVVFDRDLLPRVEIREARRPEAVEFPEEFTQEWEDVGEVSDVAAREIAAGHQAEIAARAWEAKPSDAGYRSYQLIRNVLAAYAHGCSFCVIHDARRPDLREAWFEVMAAVRSAEMRMRLKVMTWQKLAALVPEELQAFLDVKYGIVPAGRVASSIG
jgi:hypothetical protein